ncbi:MULTISPECIES: S8 family serine peptidase [Rhodomicrobium]|uniref:S8 family peptidase n=1 Tax=Rhodomicrobium TaxID=1068 RepID=UPI001AECD043|nr:MULTISPECIES: S8 family serine peptidase [Rhodomicrobium]
MQKYTILRDMNRGTSRRSAARSRSAPGDITFEATRGAGASAPDELPTPQIETASATEREALDLANDPEVASVARVMPTVLLAPVTLDANGAAPLANNASWGIVAVGADATPFTGKGASVCVLDTGIDASHPAFAGVTLNKRDFTTGATEGEPVDAAPGWDGNGHGSHCAGTILGRDVEGTRIGVARGVKKAMIGKVLGDDGSGTTDMLFSGLQWAIGKGVDVVSMSIGFDFPGLVERRVQDGLSARQAASDALVAYRANLRLFDALMSMVRARAEFDEGTVIVAASGNESNRARDIRIAVSIPAAADGMVSVGALAQKAGKHEAAFFSNTMPVVSAPGVAIRSAKSGGGLIDMNGTSMATPHVAGIAALWWEHLRARSPDGKAAAADVVMRMTATARRDDVFAGPYDKFDYGAGLVSVPQAGM